MIRKEMIAMLLAGGQGSRLGVLTAKVAKPAVAFGGKYRIIDFPLSNCINSGIDTVGVLTQYQPLRLNTHIGIGIPWDLDRNNGGVTVLPPYEKSDNSEWYSGTANAIFQNMNYMESYNPEYVLILSGDHIYKMDYEVMLDFHKENNADVTIATMPVPIEEASRFGIVITDENKKIEDFQEKPKEPKSNLASMGIYIFSWKVLKEALYAMKDQSGCDFGKHIIPYCHEKGQRLFAYECNGYWKDVGTLGSYWEANMELVDLIPEFNLYEEYWKIYTKSDIIEPQYLSPESVTEKSIIGEGSEIYGEVYHSVIGAGVTIGKGTVVRDSIVMKGTCIGEGATINKSIIAENCQIGDKVVLGVGEERRIGSGVPPPSNLKGCFYTMTQKRLFSLLMAGMLSVSLLAGCGGSSDSSADASADAAQNTADTAADASASAADSDLAYVLGNGKMKIGYTVYEPMNYTDANGEFTGFDTEFAEAVCEKLGVAPEFVEINWDTKVVELDAKSIDCIWNGMTITDDLKQNIAISDPYVKNMQVAVIKSANADKYTDVASLASASLVAEAGSAGQSVIEDEANGLSGASLTTVTKQTDALLEVASGASDAAILDWTLAKSMIGEGTDFADLVMIDGLELSVEEYGIGFRKDSDLCDKVNEIMGELIADGTLPALADKYGLGLAE